MFLLMSRLPLLTRRGLALVPANPAYGQLTHMRATRGKLIVLALMIPCLLADCSKPNNAEDQRHGQELYQFHCAPCHETPPPDLLKQPPKLKGVFNSTVLPSGAPATDEQVRTVIIEGLRTMPAFQGRLQEQEVRDLIAYLHHLR